MADFGEPSSDPDCEPVRDGAELPEETLDAHDSSASLDETADVAPASASLGPLDPTLNAAPPSEGTAKNVARTFGDYELLEEIARGGMGVVFRARQRSLNRVVAIKMILAGQLANENDIRRFLGEAEAAANLDHPGIVPIYEVGQHNGQHFFSMGYIQGQSLSGRLADGPLTPRDAAGLLRDVTDAVAYAHDHGVVHRDIKPANILLETLEDTGSSAAESHKSGGSLGKRRLTGTSSSTDYVRARVTDFGLAKRADIDTGMTASGQILGTPSYMPPEQAAGQISQIGPTSDVYSLGATLYALLTGRPPFQTATLAETLKQIIEEEPVSPRQLNTKIDRDLETICLKCLQKSPAKRYESAAALREDLDRWLNHQPIKARPVSHLSRLKRWCQRYPALAATIGFALLVTLLGVSGVTWQWREAVRSRNDEEIARKGAEAARTNADWQRGIAEQQRQAAEKAATELRSSLYAVQMNLASQAAAEGNFSRVTELLEQQRPECGRPDLRGFEWYHLWNRTQDGHLRLYGHKDGVTDMLFLPDGKRIVTASAAGRLRVWDLDSGRLLEKWKPYNFGLTSIALCPDKGTLATSGESDIRLWDLETLDLLGTLVGHTNRISAIALSSDGKRLVSASVDETVRVWNTATHTEERQFHVADGILTGVGITSDGATLIASGIIKNGRDDAILAWDMESGELIKGCPTHRTDVSSLAVSPSEDLIAESHVVGGKTFLRSLTDLDQATELVGHVQNVFQLKFSSDGSELMSVSGDKTARIWDISTPVGKEVFHLANVPTSAAWSPTGDGIAIGTADGVAHLFDRTVAEQTFPAGLVTSEALALSPDGSSIAVASPDGTSVQIRSVASLDVTTTIPVREYRAATIVFSPDSERLAVAAADRIELWDVGQQRPIASHTLQEHYPLSLAFSPDGMSTIAACNDGSMYRWHWTGKEPETAFETYAESTRNVHVSPDGRYAATSHIKPGTNKPVVLWNLQTNEAMPLACNDLQARSARFSPDGSLLAAGMEIGTIVLLNVETHEIAKSIDAFSNVIWSLDFSADGKTLAAVGGSTLKLLHLPTQQELATWTVDDPRVVRFCPDGKSLFVGQSDGTVRVYRAAEDQEEAIVKIDDAVPYALAYSGDGASIAVATAGNIVKQLDSITAEERSQSEGHTGRVEAILYVPQRGSFISAGEDGTVGVWSSATGELRQRFSAIPAHCLALSPDERVLAVGGNEAASANIGAVHLWNLETGELLSTISGLPQAVRCLDFSADSSSLAVGTANEAAGTTRVIDVSAGTTVREFIDDQLHQFGTWAAAFSPDSKTLYTGHGDNTIRSWNVSTGESIQMLTGHTGMVTDLALSPDGSLLASSSIDHTIGLWDSESLCLQHTLQGHQQAITGVAFAPDGTSLASVGQAAQEGDPVELKIWRLGKPITDDASPPVESLNVPDVPIADWDWFEPTNLGKEVNSPANDAATTLTSDELMLCFESDRPGSHGGRDLWIATRSDIKRPFDTPVNLGPQINTPGRESSPSLSGDGRILVFDSNRESGLGKVDLWISTRDSIDEAFGPASNLGATINSEFVEAAPWLSPDGLILAFHSNRPDDRRWFNLWISHRDSVDQPFGAPVGLGNETDRGNEYAPFLNADQCTLLFNSALPDLKQSAIFACQRQEVPEVFGAPIPLRLPGRDRLGASNAHMNATSSTLYFASSRPGGYGQRDLWFSRRDF